MGLPKPLRAQLIILQAPDAGHGATDLDFVLLGFGFASVVFSLLVSFFHLRIALGLCVSPERLVCSLVFVLNLAH